VEHTRANPHLNLCLEFGPTAVTENGLVAEQVVDPDYTKIFVALQAAGSDGIDRVSQAM
jgi:hypothetical protein